MSAWSIEVICAKCGSAGCNPVLTDRCPLSALTETAMKWSRSLNPAHYEHMCAQTQEAIDSGRYGTSQVADAIERGITKHRRKARKRWAKNRQVYINGRESADNEEE